MDQKRSATGTSPSEQAVEAKPSSTSGTKPTDFRGIANRLLKKRAEEAEANSSREAEVAEQEEAEAHRERFEVLKQDGVPKRIRRQLHGLEKTKPLVRIDRFIREPDQWCLVLSSPVGTGKSTAGAYWLWNISPDRSAAAGGSSIRRWWSASELASVNVFNGELTRLKQPGPLVIDDLGTEYTDKHGFFDRVLDDLIDARYREELQTLITTNLNHRAFVERYGTRVSDRIREGGAFYEFTGKSLRGQS